MAHDAFLRAILDDPDDDAPRLVYADWLDEHDDPERAEFIRIQCALAASTAGGRRREFEMREVELLARHQEEWADPVRDRVDGWTFRRGFVGRVRLDGQRFAAEPEAVLRPAPVQAVQLFWGLLRPPERAQVLVRACACPDLVRLRSLDLGNNYVGSAGAQALAACEYLAGLTALDLSQNHVGDGGLRALATAAFLPNLTDLLLSGNDIGPAGVRSLITAVRALETSGQSLRLRTLDLRENRLGMAGRREVFGEPLVRRIALL
jgi:uncharacterized protein (TIGR02996 family)